MNNLVTDSAIGSFPLDQMKSLFFSKH